MTGKVIENVRVNSVQNRAVRTLANLAQDEQCRREIHDTEGLVENMVKLIKDTDDVECQQTYLRALRYQMRKQDWAMAQLRHPFP